MIKLTENGRMLVEWYTSLSAGTQIFMWLVVCVIVVMIGVLIDLAANVASMGRM